MLVVFPQQNGYTSLPQCYIISILPVLLVLTILCRTKFQMPCMGVTKFVETKKHMTNCSFEVSTVTYYNALR
jgi:hypothetical protein